MIFLFFFRLANLSKCFVNLSLNIKFKNKCLEVVGNFLSEDYTRLARVNLSQSWRASKLCVRETLQSTKPNRVSLSSFCAPSLCLTYQCLSVTKRRYWNQAESQV